MLIKKFFYDRDLLSLGICLPICKHYKNLVCTPPPSPKKVFTFYPQFSKRKPDILYIQIYTLYSMNNLLCTSICRTVAIALLTSAISVESSVKKSKE